MARLRALSSVSSVVGVLALVTLSVGCAPAPPPGPRLQEGLTPAPPGEPASSVVGILGSDYVESEYFLTGEADTYLPDGTWTGDGRWGKVVDEADVPFTTRIIVDRPSDPARFNGTVWVEWLNVTAGADAAASVVQARDHVVASGAAWVGVSAQAAGVEAMRGANPERYGSLDVPSDGFSYDIFRQAGRAVREHPEVLGGTPAQRVIAVGDSQSALRLTTYVNAFQEDQAYDGFIIHSRFTSGAPLEAGGGFLGIMGAVPTRIRADANRPVLQLQTESEVGLNLEALQPGLGTWESVRQPNTGNVHTWEVAGAAHADKYLLESAGGNVGVGPSGLLALLCLSPSINAFPFHYAANAGFAAMERWVTDGERPASTPPIETVDGMIQRDADGNARGGLRLPDIDVPVARHVGGDNPNIMCALFGSTTPFPLSVLWSRYGTVDAYVAAYRERADAAVAAGIMTPADRDAALGVAASVRVEP